MKAERQLEIANKLEAHERMLFTPFACLSLGLLPVMFIGVFCIGGYSLFTRIVGWVCFAYMLVTVSLFFAILILHSAEVWFRDRWWRKTEDPWKVWQIDHYGKIIDD